MKCSIAFLFCCASTLVLTGSARAAAPPEVIARGGGIELGSTDVRQLVAALPEAARKSAGSDLAALEQLLRAEIARRALVQEAQAAGFERQAGVKAQLDSVHDEALLRLWIADQSQVPATYPSAAELQAAYDANKARLTTAPEYHLAQIFVSAPDGADTQKLAAALRKAADVAAKLAVTGADFQKLASDLSDHAASAAHGGDLGFLPENRLLPEVVAALKSLRPGEIAGPIKTAQGLHFVKLLEVRSGKTPALAEVQDSLKEALRAQRAQDVQQAYLEETGRKLGIVVNQVELARLQQLLR
ncbi:MAG TPA: peptidyl-prolyl cis-trans isomerase [Steroidobacteraceae bacterium]|nr:peptidyl-prolyl cis-trans isomerase [Steroidobacteraceae bacterium]